MNMLLKVYRTLFARPAFLKLNRLLYRASLSGLGVLNYENGRVSGEICFLSKLLKGRSGCVVFDVGANVGNYARMVLDICPQARIYAFEPHPQTFAALKENLPIANVVAVNAAVGERSGEVLLFDYAEKDGSSHASIYRDVIENIHSAKSTQHETTIIELESFARSEGVERIDLLKIDVEGNEYNVLKGVLGYLQAGRIRAIHFEFNEMNVSSRTYFRDFWEILSNYDIYRLLPHGMVKISEYEPVYCEVFAYQNIVAFLKQRTD